MADTNSGLQSFKERTLAGNMAGGLQQLGGMPLQQLLDYHRKYITDTYIPHWEQGVDWEYGGYDNALAPGKKPRFDTKNMYYQSRGVWMFSYVYNHFTKNKRHLDAAIKGRDFLVKHGLADGYRWITTLSREGKRLSEPLDHYGDIYMVLALTELYKATKDEKNIELAINTAKSVMARLLSPSNLHIKAHTEALEPGAHRLGDWQHFLSALTPLLKVKRDPAVEFIARYCVRVICQDHWQPKDGVLLELLDDKLRPYTFDAVNWGDFKARAVHGWHSIQACWMVMDEALRVKHYPTFRQGVQMGLSTLEHSYIDGKGIPAYNPQAKPQPTDTFFPWSALDDMLVYCMMVLEHSHEPSVINYYNKCFELHNSKPESIGTSGLLHTPRRFFYTIDILERMISRGGNVSDEWSKQL